MIKDPLLLDGFLVGFCLCSVIKLLVLMS